MGAIFALDTPLPKYLTQLWLRTSGMWYPKEKNKHDNKLNFVCFSQKAVPAISLTSSQHPPLDPHSLAQIDLQRIYLYELIRYIWVCW